MLIPVQKQITKKQKKQGRERGGYGEASSWEGQKRAKLTKKSHQGEIMEIAKKNDQTQKKITATRESTKGAP